MKHLFTGQNTQHKSSQGRVKRRIKIDSKNYKNLHCEIDRGRERQRHREKERGIERQRDRE